MTDSHIQDHYQQALETFIERVQEDRQIIAAILFGSLAYDTVWEKSDIDVMLISAESRSKAQKAATEQFFSLTENEVNIHASLTSRSDFKQLIEGAIQSSFMHSAFSKSKLLFTRDETIRDLYENTSHLGERDRQITLFRAGSHAIPSLNKAEKYCQVKEDPHYAYLWLISTCLSLAHIETAIHHQIATREVIHQALALNPDFFQVIYLDLLDQPKTLDNVGHVLQQIDAYLNDKISLLFQPLLDFLADEGIIQSVTQINHWFEREMNMSAEDAVIVCEWLADQEIIIKTSTPIRLTPRSLTEFEELAFYYDG